LKAPRKHYLWTTQLRKPWNSKNSMFIAYLRFSMLVGAWVAPKLPETWTSFFFFFFLLSTSSLFPWKEASFSKNPGLNYFRSNLFEIGVQIRGQSRYQPQQGRWKEPQSLTNSFQYIVLSNFGSHQILKSLGISWMAFGWKNICKKCLWNSIGKNLGGN
jgi:hypothetical protein